MCISLASRHIWQGEGTSGNYCTVSMAATGMLTVPIRFDYVF